MISLNETTNPRDILVVGAGVIGLTTAIRLAEAGHIVTVAAQETPSTILGNDEEDDDFDKTRKKGVYTSSGSGGQWLPFLLSGEKIEKWASIAFKEFQSVLDDPSVDAEENGVSLREAILLYVEKEPELPWFAQMTKMRVFDRENGDNVEDPRVPNEYKKALLFTAPIIQMERYLKYLEARVRSLGIHIVSLNGQSWTLEDARDFGRTLNIDVFVNCTGVCSNSFYGLDEPEEADKAGIYPGRGITVIIERPADPSKNYMISEDPEDGFLSRDGLLAYAIPRGPHLYTLGGSNFKHDWSRSSSPDEVDGVVQRACHLLQVDHSAVTVVSSWTGLRPLTKEGSARVGLHAGENDVINNYGHGGSGVTICWGCAEEVCSIVESMKGSSGQ